MGGIVKIQLERLAKRLLGREIEVEYDDSLVEYLATKGYSTQFGARPLKRLIQAEVENALANFILSGKIKMTDRVKITYKDGKVGFKKF
jgi:ATP-dependent Clp protease ATP-binding subunit ClpB